VAERELKKSCVTPKPKLSCWYWLVPCIAAFLVYARSLSFGFVHDDWGQILTLRYWSWSFLPRILSAHLGTMTYYRPVFLIWFVIVHTVAGISPLAWHLANILLHVLVTFLVFKFALEILGSPVTAVFAACLFAIHPIHIEDVCWVSAGNEIIYTGFVLCSLLLLFYGNRQLRPAYIWFSLAAWGVALFTKETAIALLPLFVLLAYRGWPRGDRTSRLSAAAYVVVALSYFAARWIVLHNLLAKSPPHIYGMHLASWNEALMTSPFAMEFYLRKLAIPTGLSPMYMNSLQTTANANFWLTAVAFFLGIALIAYVSSRRLAWTVASSLLFLPLLPVLAGIRFFRYVEFEMVHDRYLYLPSVGLVLIFGFFMKYLWSRSRNAAIALSALLFALSIWLNCTQQGFYRNQRAFTSRSLVLEGWPVGVAEAVRQEIVYEKCKDGRSEEARDEINAPPLSVSFYRITDGLLFSAASFDVRDGRLSYVTPEGKRGAMPMSDLDPSITACLNPEMVGQLFHTTSNLGVASQ
jgi:hypothetical protein